MLTCTVIIGAWNILRVTYFKANPGDPKACVSSCSFVGNVGSCPSEDIDVPLLCGSVLCDGLITSSEES
jgi:hypothetical protein